MVCTTPPTQPVEIVVQLTSLTPVTAVYTAGNAASTQYLLNDTPGHLDFSCFKKPVTVTFRLAAASVNQGIVFDGGYNGSGTPLTFSDKLVGGKTQVPPVHHQFPGGPPAGGATSFTFVYRNDWDCGDGSHQPHCSQSQYGLRFASKTTGHIGETDPIVNNGGNQN